MTTPILDRLAAELTTLGVKVEQTPTQIVSVHAHPRLSGHPLFTLSPAQTSPTKRSIHCNSLPFGVANKMVSCKSTVRVENWPALLDRCHRILASLKQAEENIEATRKAWAVRDLLYADRVPFSVKVMDDATIRLSAVVPPEEALALAPKLTRLLRPQATGEQPRIYTASRVRHAPKWRTLREAGFRITSTWIDEAEEGASPSKADLWDRCIREATESDAVLAYFEAEDPRVGALVEVGAALAWGVPVYVVNLTDDSVGSWVHHPKCTIAPDLAHAVRMMGLRFGVDMPALPEGLTG